MPSGGRAEDRPGTRDEHRAPPGDLVAEAAHHRDSRHVLRGHRHEVERQGDADEGAEGEGRCGELQARDEGGRLDGRAGAGEVHGDDTAAAAKARGEAHLGSRRREITHTRTTGPTAHGLAAMPVTGPRHSCMTMPASIACATEAGIRVMSDPRAGTSPVARTRTPVTTKAPTAAGHPRGPSPWRRAARLRAWTTPR